MRDRKLDNLFLRWRDRGDPRALTRLFDAAAPELLALASHLVREADQAEDLVQTTFVAAIEHAPRWDPARPVFPWLVGILTREARMWNRRAARASEVEPPVDDAEPDAATAASRVEVSATLRNAIDGLPARYRDVVRPWFEDGKKPREIAAARGLAPGTVRVQLHRGLDLLRKALPSGIALGAALHLTPTRGLALVRAEVLAAAHAVGGATAVAAAVAPTPLFGVTLVSTKTLAALAAAAGIAGVLYLTPPADVQADALETETTRVAAAPPAKAILEESTTHETPRETDPASHVVAPTIEEDGRKAIDGSSAHELVLEVTGLVKPPQDGVQLVVDGGAGIQTSVFPTGDGSARFDISALFPEGSRTPEELQLTLEGRPEYEPFEASAHRINATSYFARVELAYQGATLTGRVVVPEGHEVENVRVALYRRNGAIDRFGNEQVRGWISHFGFQDDGSARTDAAGRFTIELDNAKPGRLVTQAAGLAVHEQDVDFSEGSDLDVGDIELDEGLAIEGRALYRGEPIRDGKVYAWGPEDSRPFQFAFSPSDPVWDGSRFRHRKLEVEVDGEGFFRIAGLVEATYELTAVPRETDGRRADYARSPGDGVPVDAPATGVILESDLRVAVVEVRAAGEPLPGAAVRRVAEGGGGLDGSFRDFRMDIFPPNTDRDGRNRFLVAPDAVVKLMIDAPGWQMRELVLRGDEFPVGEPLVVELERGEDPTELVVELVYDGRESLEGYPVGLTLLSFPHSFQQVDPVPIEGRRLVYPSVVPGEYQAGAGLALLPFRAPDDQPYVLLGKFNVPADRSEPVQLPCTAGGRIRLHVAGVGAALPEFELRRGGKAKGHHYLVETEDGGSVTRGELTPGIPNLIGGRALDPDTYEIVQVGEAYGEVSGTVEVLPGETVELHLTLTPR